MDPSSTKPERINKPSSNGSRKRLNAVLKTALTIFLGLIYGTSLASDNGNSVYQARIPLMTQHATASTLDMYRGHPLMIIMFYGSCPDVCPMLIMGMQTYEKQLAVSSRKKLRGLVVSFDAVRDTPSQLQAIATMHHADEKRWTFAAASEIDARKLAALLAVQYRQKSDGTFDHSVLITLLDAQGRIVASTSKLNGDTQFLAALRKQTSP